jgi:uncharacterized iron-regulated membrane protein
MKAVFSNPRRVTVEGGGGGFPWEAAALVLVLAAVVGVAHAAAPYAHVLGVVLAIAATLAGCGLLALGGLVFSRWEERRQEPEPLRRRSGERIREPRR